MIKSLLTNAVSSALPIATDNALGGLKTKVSELGSKVSSTFGGSGPFKKLGVKAPSLDVSAANQLFARAQMLDAVPGMTTSQIDEAIRSMSPSPWQGTEVDSDAATKLVKDAIEQDVSAAQQKQQQQAEGKTVDDLTHIISLTEVWSGLVIPFRIMPEIVESRSVEYEAVAPPQSPTAFQKYKGTSNAQWTINATFACRTTEEATENLAFLNTLRGWTMPFFGQRLQKYGQDWLNRLGAPPPILKLEGWRQNMVGPTYVVITSLNWNFPRDVDYIPAQRFDVGENGLISRVSDAPADVPFPTVMQVQIQLVEAFSTDQVNGFDLAKFRAGKFDEAWIRAPKSESATVTEWKTEPPQEAQQTQVTAPSVPDTSPPSEPEVVEYISPEEPLTNRTGGYSGGGE